MAITYRPDDERLAMIEKLKSRYDISTTTKLIDYLIDNSLSKDAKISKQKSTIASLDNQIYVRNESISNFIDSFENLRALSAAGDRDY